MKVRELNWQKWKLEDLNEKRWKLKDQFCIFYLNEITIVWLWWEVDVTIGKYEKGIQDEIKRGKNFVLDLGLSLTFSWVWV